MLERGQFGLAALYVVVSVHRRPGPAVRRPLAGPGGRHERRRQVRQFTVSDEDDGIRLDRWFKRNLPEVSFGQVSRWARTGQLRLDGKRATPGDRIEAGQGIRVPPQGEEAPTRPQPKRRARRR